MVTSRILTQNGTFMSDHTIANICLQRLLRNDRQHYFNKETLEQLWEVTSDRIMEDRPSIKRVSLYGLVVDKIEKLLISDLNSVFLSVSDLRRKHDIDTKMTRFMYVVSYPMGNQIAFQCVRFAIDKKAAFLWSGLVHEIPLVMSRHSVERLFVRFHTGAAREGIDQFMFLIKLIMISASTFFQTSGGVDENDHPLDKIPVPGGHFPLIYESDRIVLATYIDDGLYRDDQDPLVELSKLSEALAGSFMTLMEKVHQQRIPVKLSGKEYLVRRVRSYYPTPHGLQEEEVVRNIIREINEADALDRLKNR